LANLKEKAVNFSRILIVGLIGLSAGCANHYLPYPRAVAGPGLEQQKLTSAGHWNVLARNESQQLINAVQTNPALFVQATNGQSSPFEQAFRDMLVSSLVTAGAQVYLKPEDALLQVEYDIQTVVHRRPDRQRPRPGLATGAVAAAAVIKDAVDSWGQPELVLIPIAIGVDLWHSFWPGSTEEITEVVINTRLHDGRRLLRADSRVYYFDAGDMYNYRDQGRSFPVVGGL
jgi:hypothetical protein